MVSQKSKDEKNQKKRGEGGLKQFLGNNQEGGGGNVRGEGVAGMEGGVKWVWKNICNEKITDTLNS